MHKKAVRYMDNAKELLGRSPIKDNTYTDVKYIKSACGVAYLGVLKAIDDYLLRHGLTDKELPQSVEGYRKALQKHVSIHPTVGAYANGKLLTVFEAIYRELHIAGYYRGNLRNTGTVKESFKAAKEFIEKIRAA